MTALFITFEATSKIFNAMENNNDFFEGMIGANECTDSIKAEINELIGDRACGLVTKEQLCDVIESMISDNGFMVMDFNDIRYTLEGDGEIDSITLETTLADCHNILKPEIARIVDAHNGKKIKRVIFHFTANDDFTIEHIRTLHAAIQEAIGMDDKIDIIWGCSVKKSTKDTVRIILVAVF